MDKNNVINPCDTIVVLCETLHIAWNCLYASLSLWTLIATKSSFSNLFRTRLSSISTVNAVDNSSVPANQGIAMKNC